MDGFDIQEAGLLCERIIDTVAEVFVGNRLLLRKLLAAALFNSVESTTNTTVLWQFLAISGVFIFIVGSFFLNEARAWISGFWHGGRTTLRAVLGGEAGTSSAAG